MSLGLFLREFRSEPAENEYIILLILQFVTANVSHTVDLFQSGVNF